MMRTRPFRPDSSDAVSIPGGFTMLLILLPLIAVAQADSGKTLFESRCARCHADPASLKTAPDRIAALLRSDQVRQHRFTLSNTQLSAIAEYLRAAGSRS